MAEIVRKLRMWMNRRRKLDVKPPEEVTLSDDCFIPRPLPASISQQSVILYCPDTGGHRPLYLSTLTEYFLKCGATVIVAFRGVYLHAEKRYTDDPFRFPDSKFTDEDVVLERITSADPLNKDFWEALIKLQSKFDPVMFVLIDGDRTVDQLAKARSRKNEIFSPLVGVFIRTDFLYDDTREKSNGQFLLRDAWRHNLIDSAIVTDTGIGELVGESKVVYVPELVCVDYSAPSPSAEQYRAFYDAKLDEIEAFKSLNKDVTILLNLGDLEPRKGYGWVLRYAADNENVAILRIGRTKRNFFFSEEDTAAREKLLKERRLYEINTYITDNRVFMKAFEVADITPLPYQRHLRSSGVLIDSLRFGLPVIVPRLGTMGRFIKDNGGGAVFDSTKFESFSAALESVLRGNSRIGHELVTIQEKLSKGGVFEALDSKFKLLD